VKRYSVCQRCGRPIVGRPTAPPFITTADATLWRHVGPLGRFASHAPAVPEADQ